MKTSLKYSIFLTAVLFCTVLTLRAQTPTPEYIEITNLEQLNAIRYDLDGDGEVPASMKLAAGVSPFPTTAPTFASATAARTALIAAMTNESKVYVEAFPGGKFYLTAGAAVADARGDAHSASAGTTYFYRLSDATTSRGYKLMNDLDFNDADGAGAGTDRSIWAETPSGGTAVTGAVETGFPPIGSFTTYFGGNFDGNKKKIMNLFIDLGVPTANTAVGLFAGISGRVRRLTLEDGKVEASKTTAAFSQVGALTGKLQPGSRLDSCFVINVDVIVQSTQGGIVTGGLVGYAASSSADGPVTIRNCYTTGDVTTKITAGPGTAGVDTGGLVGTTFNANPTDEIVSIRNCYATGAVTATNTGGLNNTGGLVGDLALSSVIEFSYATGDVSATNTEDDASSLSVGGLVGESLTASMIAYSYAEGAVSATGTNTEPVVGGLVGLGAGSIKGCYAKGAVTGTITTFKAGAGVLVGGLVGSFFARGTDKIEASYTTSVVKAIGGAGRAFAGGLVGAINAEVIGAISNCYVASTEISATSTSTTVGDVLTGGLWGKDIETAAPVMATYSLTLGPPVAVLSSYFDYEKEATVTSTTTSTRKNARLGDYGLGVQSTSVLQSVAASGIYLTWTEEDGGYYIWSFCGDAQYPKLSVDFDGDGSPSVSEFGTQGDCGTQTVQVLSTFASTHELASLKGGQISSSEITTLKGAQTTQGTEITTLKATQTTQGTEITTLKATQTTQGTEITTLKGAQTTQGTELTTLKAAQATLVTEITAIKTGQAVQDATLVALQTGLEALKTQVEAAIARIPGATPTTPPTGTTPTTPTPTGTSNANTMTFSVPQVDGSVSVFPNPSDRLLQFTNLVPTEHYTYKVYTSSGNLVRSGSVQNNDQVDISALSGGQYIIVLQDIRGIELLRDSLLVK